MLGAKGIDAVPCSLNADPLDQLQSIEHFIQHLFDRPLLIFSEATEHMGDGASLPFGGILGRSTDPDPQSWKHLSAQMLDRAAQTRYDHQHCPLLSTAGDRGVDPCRPRERAADPEPDRTSRVPL